MQPQVHFKVSISLGLEGASTPPGRCPLTPPGALKRARAPLATLRMV